MIGKTKEVVEFLDHEKRTHQLIISGLLSTLGGSAVLNKHSMEGLEGSRVDSNKNDDGDLEINLVWGDQEENDG